MRCSKRMSTSSRVKMSVLNLSHSLQKTTASLTQIQRGWLEDEASRQYNEKRTRGGQHKLKVSSVVHCCLCQAYDTLNDKQRSVIWKLSVPRSQSWSHGRRVALGPLAKRNRLNVLSRVRSVHFALALMDLPLLRKCRQAMACWTLSASTLLHLRPTPFSFNRESSYIF
jgi:hypothetical protein